MICGMPSSLTPGQSATVVIGFATNQITEQLSLYENTQFQHAIVSTTLHRP
jgi:hypothetical protein